MHRKSIAEKDLSPRVICTAPWRLKKVTPLSNYKLNVEFMDGTHGSVEMSHLILSDKSGVFSKLKDTKLFNDVYLDLGVVTWPGEIDLAPDAMYDEIKHHGEWILK